MYTKVKDCIFQIETSLNVVFSLFVALSLSLAIPNVIISQSVPRCFSKEDLIGLQKKSVENIEDYFEKNGWTESRNSEYYFSEFFDHDLGYERLAWTKESDKLTYLDILGFFRLDEQHFVLFHAEGKPNILVFVPDIYDLEMSMAIIEQLNYSGFAGELTSYDGHECFRRLKKGATAVESVLSNDVSVSRSNGLTFNFVEFEDKENYILIYDENAYNVEVKAIEERILKYNTLINEGDSYYANMQFEQAQVKYVEADQMEPTIELKYKIINCKESITKSIKNAGDSLLQLKDYAGAKRKYQEALSFYSDSQLSGSLAESVRQCSIRILRDEAEAFYESNELKRALDRYNSLLELDNNDQDAKEKITHIQNTIEFLKKRESVTYSYRETQKEDYNRLCRDLLTTINSGIDESLNGQLKGSIKIEFDTSGKNLSSIQNLHTSLNDALILGSLKGASLTPTKFFGYHAASKETIEISSDWNSTFSTLKFKKKGISGNNLPSQTISTIQNFASKNEIYQGKCEVAIKSKNFNNSKYVDIDLIRYKAVGPEAALYSLVLPGLGSYKATAGRKGLLRFESFLVSAGIAVGAEMLSRNTYDEYLAANEPQKMNDLYNKANLYHKISLVAAGLTASIYVYELVDAFHLGLKNTKRTKYVREELKKKPISIQKQNIDKM